MLFSDLKKNICGTDGKTVSGKLLNLWFGYMFDEFVFSVLAMLSKSCGVLMAG